MSREADLVEALERLFSPVEEDASLNLQGALDDLRGRFNPKDGGVIAGTVERAIARLEQTRETLARYRASAEGGETFQGRVAPWMQRCFGPEISADRVERGDRFLEEVFELLQSGGYDPSRIVTLRDYVWRRPVGEPSQEVGGVMVTLAAYCLAHGLDMHASGEAELARINAPKNIEKIRLKQATKAAAIGNSSPLPIAPKEPRL